jgi:RNA ligase
VETNKCREALTGLTKLIRTLDKAGVWNKVSFREWRKGHEAFMEKCLGYERGPGMPSVTALVSAFFHPELPLIGLNYTPVAHNTLHAFPAGWTPALRLCRGIIFDRSGALVAKPFEKFFNYGEHAETRNLPDEAFTATVKHDGHLGIIFEYRNAWHITTRGDFTSRTSKVGAEMLQRYVQKGDWDRKLPCGDNLLVEIIHPSTKVHLKYRGSRFILIGAYERDTLRDLDHEELSALGKQLRLPVTEPWNGRSIEDLFKLTQDLSVGNQEGFVVRFQSGLRVKFKFASYINLMVAGKLGYGYIMNRMLAGNLEKMIKNLPEEVYDRAAQMVDDITQAAAAQGTEKERRERLYRLVPSEESTQYYRGICRKLLKKLETE